MKRRTVVPVFLFFSLVFGMLPSALSRSDAAEGSERQYYELRMYTVASDSQLEQMNAYWENAAIPAFGRLHVGPIGVFTELEPASPGHVFVLIPYASLQQYEQIPLLLASDEVYQQAADSYLNAPKESPAYERMEVSLLRAFEGMKQLQVPAHAQVFELRKYISASENKGLNKIQMFEDGELTLMQEIGLAPVFFSQTLVGTQMPNLVYMTSGEDLETHKQHWSAFSDAPVWQALKNDPQYKDNMNGMERYLLKRTSASQF